MKCDVLVIEDNDDLRKLMELMLKSNKIKAVGYSTPENILELIATHQPKVILMDMLLSGFDGRDYCTLVKEDTNFNHIKIIMASAHPEGEKMCLDAGANYFIEKPFEMVFFVDTLKKALQ